MFSATYLYVQCHGRKAVLTNLQVCDALSYSHDNTTGLVTHDHWLLDDEVANLPLHPVVYVRATDAN